VSGRLSTTISRRALISTVAGSRCLSAAGIGFLVILCPPRSWAFLTVGLPDPTGPDLDGVSTFRTLKMRPGWAPSIARERWCSYKPTTIIDLHLAHRSAVSLHRATTSITARLRLTSHQRGFKQFARPVFPSPVAPGWNTGPWAFPRASHPASTRSARRGGDRSSSTSLGRSLPQVRRPRRFATSKRWKDRVWRRYGLHRPDGRIRKWGELLGLLYREAARSLRTRGASIPTRSVADGQHVAREPVTVTTPCLLTLAKL
jgi:hypothetical protein